MKQEAIQSIRESVGAEVMKSKMPAARGVRCVQSFKFQERTVEFSQRRFE